MSLLREGEAEVVSGGGLRKQRKQDPSVVRWSGLAQDDSGEAAGTGP